MHEDEWQMGVDASPKTIFGGENSRRVFPALYLRTNGEETMGNQFEIGRE